MAWAGLLTALGHVRRGRPQRGLPCPSQSKISSLISGLKVPEFLPSALHSKAQSTAPCARANSPGNVRRTAKRARALGSDKMYPSFSNHQPLCGSQFPYQEMGTISLPPSYHADEGNRYMETCTCA